MRRDGTVRAILGKTDGIDIRRTEMIRFLPLLRFTFEGVATFTVLMPTSVLASVGQSRFSHYFGWDCRRENHCLDQQLNQAAVQATGLCRSATTSRTHKNGFGLAMEQLIEPTNPILIQTDNLAIEDGVLHGQFG